MKYILKKILFLLVIIGILSSCHNEYINYSYELQHLISLYNKINRTQYNRTQYNRTQYNRTQYIKQGYKRLQYKLNNYIPINYAKLDYYDVEEVKIDEYKKDPKYAHILAKYAIGTSVIMITAVMTVATTGIGIFTGTQTATSKLSFVFFAAFKGSVAGAFSGATIGALSELVQDTMIYTGQRYILNDTDKISMPPLEYSADGFMWGAITGAFIGSGIGKKLFENIPIDSKINKPKNGGNLSVPYIDEIFEKNGKKYRGFFPKFDSFFNSKLPSNLWQATDVEQFKYAVKQLKKAVLKNGNLRSKFTKEQLEAILEESPRIPGLTWHHHQQKGLLQLVDSEIHARNQNPHTGGRSIWGGGKEAR